MRFGAFALWLVALWSCTSALHAQGSVPAVPSPCSADVGGTSATLTCPQGFDFYYDLGEVYEPLTAAFASLGNTDGAFFKFNFAVTGGSLPPGLTVSPSGVFSGTLTTEGQFNFTLTITISFGVEGTTVFSDSAANPASFIVTPYSGPAVTINPAALSFSLTQNAAAVTQSISIANHGSQAVQFSASATTNSGGNWLQLSSPQGSITPSGSFGLAVTADPSKLAPGTYSGAVTISIPGAPPLGVSVLAVVAGAQPNIQLSQTGLRFQAVSGGTATSPQTITVVNSGTTVNFAASASTLSGGNWLSVSPSSGTSGGATAGAVTVSVNPAGLEVGNYYGQIEFSASGALNSPQVASVVLNVVSPANSPGAFVQPTGLIFVGSANGTNPAAQTLSITNPSPTALTFLVTAFGNTGSASASSWLTATPSSGSVSATEPATVSVQANLAGLAAGAYVGDLVLTIAPATSTSTPPTTPAAAPQVFHLEILLIVLPAGSSPSLRSDLGPHASGCTPTQLLPVFTLLGSGFTAAAGWPTAIGVTVVDDCGNPLDSGSVTVTFSSGDPALSLEPLGNGRWSATWNATHTAASVAITAQAQEVQPALTGSASIGGALQPNNATPAVSSGGVVSAANFAGNQPLAPGSFGAIFGTNLSAGLTVSTQLPLSTQLGGTSVILGGKQLPLLFVSGAQINVVVPYDTPVNSTQQLVVQNGSAISIPQSVFIAAAEPAIFTQNGSGTGAALIEVYNSDDSALPIDSPVSAGDVIVLFCTGLGAVNPSVSAGSTAPASPLSQTVNPVTVTIGQVTEPVQFAGLVPGFAQLYQVNLQIPTGLPSGNADLTLSVAGQQSAPVSITVQ
jgi:uncharacterized protein (TIGR03437 family)